MGGLEWRIRERHQHQRWPSEELLKQDDAKSKQRPTAQSRPVLQMMKTQPQHLSLSLEQREGLQLAGTGRVTYIGTGQR